MNNKFHLKLVNDTGYELHTFCAADLEGRDVPPRQWLAKPVIPHENVALLSGDGGLGKTILALMIGTSLSARTNWLGIECMQGPFLYVGAEDDKDELDRRLDSMRIEMGLSWGDLADFHYKSFAGEDALIATFDKATQQIKPTRLLDGIEKRISELGAIACALDTSADMFGGDEISRAQVRQFVGLLRGICLRQHCTIILLAHPSLTGNQHWERHERIDGMAQRLSARLYLTEDGADYRVLEFKKSNYSAKGKPMRLLYRNGVFVPDDGKATASAQVNAEAKFMQMLDLYNAQGRDVSAKPSADYAPAMFAKDPMATGINKATLVTAMNALFGADKIKVEVVGPPSRQTKRIIRT